MKTAPLFLLLLISVGCAPKETARIEPGADLYANKCGGCHRLYKKESFQGEKWKEIMARMKIKAHLNETEEKLITQYLTK